MGLGVWLAVELAVGLDDVSPVDTIGGLLPIRRVEDEGLEGGLAWGGVVAAVGFVVTSVFGGDGEAVGVKGSIVAIPGRAMKVANE